MPRVVQGTTFRPFGQMNEKARENAGVVIEELASAYAIGRDSVAYANNIREEARDQLVLALGSMRVRVFTAGPYRVHRYRDESRSLNLLKVKALLGDKAKGLEHCYDSTPRYSVHVYRSRADELARAATVIRREGNPK